MVSRDFPECFKVLGLTNLNSFCASAHILHKCMSVRCCHQHKIKETKQPKKHLGENMKKNPWFSSSPSSQSSPCSTQPHPEGRRRADTARGGDSCLETGSRNGEVKHISAAARPHLHSRGSLGHTSSHNVPSKERLQPASFSLHFPWRVPALCLCVSPPLLLGGRGEGWKATTIQTGTEAWNLPVGFLPLAESSQAGCRNRIHTYLYIF